MNGFPGFGAVPFDFMVLMVIFPNTDASLQGLGVCFQSPSQATKSRIIFYTIFLKPKPTLLIEFGNGIPTYHMHSLSRTGGNPNKVFLDPINEIMDFKGQSSVLHDVIRDATEASFRKSGSTRNVEELCLPSS